MLSLSIVMGNCGVHTVTAAIISVMVLVHIVEVDSASNLEIIGNQVSGESFHLECSTRTINTTNVATFYRSTNSGQLGSRVGHRWIYPHLSPSCRQGNFPSNYTVSCNSDGSMFTLIISSNNAIEHRTYWRCGTKTDSRVLDNNVIFIQLHNLKINGNQVSGESFTLECITRTNATANYASFYRSTSSEQLGTRVGYREFFPEQTPSCNEKSTLLTHYNVSCNSDGSMFSLTIPANNTIEHSKYWRCGTNTDSRVLENNVIFIKLNNLKINGNQVSGGSFTLKCLTRTNDTTNHASFYRSTSSEQLGTHVGEWGFYPHMTPSCIKTQFPINYTVSCNSDGSMFSLTIPANNTIAHNTYWRCGTDIDSSVWVNNVIAIFITIPITGISMIGPRTNPNISLTVTTDQPITFQCQTTQGRPAANVTWYLANKPLSGGTTTTTQLSGDMVITTGYLTLRVNMPADDKVLSCSATNYVNMKPVESSEKLVIRGKWRTESCPEGSITGPVLGAVLGGIIIGVIVMLGTQYLRGHWRDNGPEEDTTQSSSENQLSTGDHGTPVYTNLELTLTTHVEQDQHYQDLTPDRSASTSAYQTLDIADTVMSGLDT